MEGPRPNGNREDAGAPRKGSHESVITLKKAKLKTGKIAELVPYTKRRINQIWSEFLGTPEGRLWLSLQKAPVAQVEPLSEPDKEPTSTTTSVATTVVPASPTAS